MNRSLLHLERTRTLWTAAKVSIIVLLGVILGIIAAVSTATVYKQSLIDRARTATQAISAADVAALRGDDTDTSRTAYKKVKSQLINLHEVNRDSRFVYVMGERNDEVFFYADSEPADSEDYSPPGQVFEEASPGLRDMFKSGDDVIEGPIRDRWGIWLSALTPINDPSTGELVAVLGIDVPAKEYMTLLGLVAAFPISIAIIAAIVIGVVDVARRRRQETVEMQAELVSVITHELNNPLTGIRWGAELLLSSYYKDGPSANVTKAIYASVRKLQENVDDVLDIARLGRNATQLTLSSIDITALIQEIFATQKLPADHKQVAMVLDPSVPAQLFITCDESKMKRVFNNLISNAIKYTGSGKVVTVSYAKDGNNHTLTVSDQGIGIPKEEQEKVFAGFYRASNALKSGERGTGMGLFLVRKTMQQHGGDILLDSDVDKGTRITILLPDRPAPTPIEPPVEPKIPTVPVAEQPKQD